MPEDLQLKNFLESVRKLGVHLFPMWKEIFSQVLIEQSRLGEADNNEGWGWVCGAMGVGRGNSQVGRGLFGRELVHREGGLGGIGEL